VRGGGEEGWHTGWQTDSSGLKGGRSGESSANNERTHFLFILLLSEWPSLVDASSEPDSLPFFGRAAGIETARKKASQGEGEGKPRRRRAVVIITVAKVADGFVGTGAQDFEQSRSNHGWPRVALGARFGHSLWIFPKIQYQVQIRPLVFEKFYDTTTRLVGASRR
jgi:hypothetical protein